MSWKRPDAQGIALFKALCPGPPVECASVFGCPAAFLAGNMFFGAVAEGLWVRLDESGHAAVVALGGQPLEATPGKAMKRYVLLPSRLTPDEQRTWVDRAHTHAATLLPARPRP